MKKLISLILTLTLICGAVSIAGAEMQYITRDKIVYTIEGGNAYVYRCDVDRDGEVVIPKEISGYEVSGIYGDAFYSCKKIERVDLSALSSDYIRDGTFKNCTSLKEVLLPQTVEGIGEDAFANCTSLEKIDLSNKSTTAIWQYAFAGCRSLKNVTLPQTLLRIGSKAFAYCTSMEEIELPKSLEAIEQAPFAGCENLKEVKIHPENESFSLEGGVIYNKDKTELVCCLPYVTGSFTVPENVSKIAPGAFYASGIEELTIGENVPILETYAVQYCKSLKKLNIFSEKIEGGAILHCLNLREVVLGESVKETEEEAFVDCIIGALSVKNDSLSLEGAMYYGEAGIIAGNAGSEAEKYALENGNDFLTLGEEAILVNGKMVHGALSQVLDEETYLPIKPVAEALGASVMPKGTSGGVVIERKNLKIQIDPGKNELYKNGEKIMLSRAPRVLNGLLYVPQSAIETAFDSEVYGSEDLNSVLIYERPDKNEPVIPPTDISGKGLTESFYIGEDDKPYVCFRDEAGNMRIKTDYISYVICDDVPLDDDKYFDFVSFSPLGFIEGFIMMYKGDQKGYMDVYGNELVMGVYKTIEPFQNGLAMVSSRPITAAPGRGGIKMGFINKKGESVIEEKYVGAKGFSEGLCAVNENYEYGVGGWYFIDETGKRVFGDKTFLDATRFRYGYCAVQTKGSRTGEGKFSYIDRTGNLATDKEWDSVSAFDETGRAEVWDGDTLKIINRSFEVVEVVEGAVRNTERFYLY